jgi:hypothetical protein
LNLKYAEDGVLIMLEQRVHSALVRIVPERLEQFATLGKISGAVNYEQWEIWMRSKGDLVW